MEKLLIYRERFLKFLTARGRYIQSGMRFLGGTVLFYVLGELDIQRPFHSHFLSL